MLHLVDKRERWWVIVNMLFKNLRALKLQGFFFEVEELLKFAKIVLYCMELFN